MFSRLRLLISSTLRYKLLALVLFPMLLVMPVTIGLAAYWSKHFGYQQLFMKVNTDLSVVHDAFLRSQQDFLSQLGRLADSYTLRTGLYEGDGNSIRKALDRLKNEAGFDFLHIADSEGNWLYEGRFKRDRRSKPSSLLMRAVQDGQPLSGVEIFSQQELLRESEALASHVRLPLVSTPRALPISRKFEERGMMLRMIYPVRAPDGRVLAVLDGGVLLNGNFGFVDDIRDLVYGPGSLVEDSIGTVTVFLDDVRISTNVPSQPGERALGTRVSQEVRHQVLGKGKNWIDRAFVVNDWYISAYEPIYDVNRDRVGMLYAGFLEAPFREVHEQAFMILLGLFVLVTTVSVWLAIRGAKSIFKPIESMTAVVRATQAGQERRIGRVESKDEIGELARQFDIALDQLKEQHEQITRSAEELEHKVDERTAELKEKNRELKSSINLLTETRKQLVLAEKLAALGELTAGIAHEINNPTAVILGNMELLIAELGEAVEPVRTEAELVIEQVYRIRSIIDSLLHYSRPEGGASGTEAIDVNTVIKDTLPLVRYILDKGHVQIELDLRADRTIAMNRQELQQVLVNLIVNAAHAMREPDACLSLATVDWGERGVVLRVQDNGTGISQEHIDKLFDPFFTTKHSGTGLGLSVSHGLVRRYGGNITVESLPGDGSVFSVWLPGDARPAEQEVALQVEVRT